MCRIVVNAVGLNRLFELGVWRAVNVAEIWKGILDAEEFEPGLTSDLYHWPMPLDDLEDQQQQVNNSSSNSCKKFPAGRCGSNRTGSQLAASIMFDGRAGLLDGGGGICRQLTAAVPVSLGIQTVCNTMVIEEAQWRPK